MLLISSQKRSNPPHTHLVVVAETTTKRLVYVARVSLILSHPRSYFSPRHRLFFNDIPRLTHSVTVTFLFFF